MRHEHGRQGPQAAAGRSRPQHPQLSALAAHTLLARCNPRRRCRTCRGCGSAQLRLWNAQTSSAPSHSPKLSRALENSGLWLAAARPAAMPSASAPPHAAADMPCSLFRPLCLAHTPNVNAAEIASHIAAVFTAEPGTANVTKGYWMVICDSTGRTRRAGTFRLVRLPARKNVRLPRGKKQTTMKQLTFLARESGLLR